MDLYRNLHSRVATRHYTIPTLRTFCSVFAGTVLLLIVLFVVNVHFGNPEPGVYVPPRWENGHIVPGHVEPQR